MIHAIRARHAVWAPIMAGVVETIGRGTPLYFAAIRAVLGKDAGGTKFVALVARLPAKDRSHLCGRIKELDTERAGAGCAT